MDRLRHKETDRALALETGLNQIGARVSILGNVMEIEGASLEGGTFDSLGDHRIAMAGAVAGLWAKKGVKIRRWQAVAKSYPQFFDDLNRLQGGAP